MDGGAGLIRFDWRLADSGSRQAGLLDLQLAQRENSSFQY